MKKFIILLMSIVLLFSVFAMSACDSGDTGEVNSSSETSSEEESSSLGKVSRNFGGGSSSIDTETSGGNGFIPTTSSGGNGTTSVPEVSFSGESFYAPETPVPDGTSFEASLIILQISNIEVTTSNYEMAEVNIKMAEEEYNKLTPSQKAEVINYQHLVAAREALNKIKAAGVWAKFEQGVNALPAPEALKNANVDTVYSLRDLMNENRSTLSQNAGFSALETTLNACLDKIKSSLVETAYIAQLDTSNASFFGISGSISSGSQSQSVVYSDKTHPSETVWKHANFTTLTFTPVNPGTLTVYVRPNQSRTYTITCDGETVSQFNSSSGGTNIVEVDVYGTVTITSSGGTGYLIAIKYNYPNLG